MCMTFEVTSLGGKVVELVPGGSDKELTWEARDEWCDALLHYRLHEFDVQVDAIRRGFGTIIPERLLRVMGSRVSPKPMLSIPPFPLLH